MYLRLKNKLDLEGFCKFFEEQGKKDLFEKMMEDVCILDTAYGDDRGSYDMGGYLLFFPTSDDFHASLEKLVSLYHLESDDYEYDDIIWEDEQSMIWKKRLYLLSSDDALLMYYPEKGGV